MKRHIILFMILTIVLASCSELTNKNTSIDFSVSGGQLLARAAEASENEIDVFDLMLTLTDVASGEVIDTISELGTLDTLKEKTFTFKKIKIGTKVKLGCEVLIDGELLWTGESDVIVIGIGANSASIKMKKVAIDEVIEVKLTFVFGDDIENIVLKGKHGEPLTTPEIPAKEGYKFVCWVDADGNELEIGDFFPEKDITYTAKWEVIHVESVTISKSSIKFIGAGKEDELTVKILPENALNKTVTWTSSDAKVATVENGVIKSVSEGTATITATADGKSATCDVVVVETFTQEEFRSLLLNYKESTEDFEIPDGYTKIVGTADESVFAGWVALDKAEPTSPDEDNRTKVTIPSSVSYIDAYAFYGCRRIRFEFEDPVGWMYYSLDDKNQYLEKDMLSEPWFINKMMINRKGYIQKKTAIDVDFPFGGSGFQISSGNAHDVTVGKTVNFCIEGIYGSTYQWYIDGVPVEGATDFYFDWDTTGYTSGNYCVMCIVDGKTSDTYPVGIGIDTTN